MNLSKLNHPAILTSINISMITVFHRNPFYYTALTGLHVTMQSSFRFFTSRFRQFLLASKNILIIDILQTPGISVILMKRLLIMRTILPTSPSFIHIYMHVGVLGREFRALPFHSSLRIISSAFDIKNNQILPFFT